MSALNNLVMWGQYFCFFLLPAVVVVLGAWWIGSKDQGDLARRRLLLLLVTAALSLALLDLLIWTNPYGREISSSLPAFGVLPVSVALLVLILIKPGEIARLWATDRAILAALILVIGIMSGLLWLAEPRTFYVIVILVVALSGAWLVGTRSGSALLTLLSLLSLGCLVFASGGAYFTPGPDDPAWWQTALTVMTIAGMLLAIFLPPAVLYASLRGEAALDWRRFTWRLALVVIMLSGIAYQVFWDGIWSAAHARAFEDHLPFVHFLLCLMAGLLLTFSLHGQRRWAGPAYVVLVTTVTTLALILGWNVSAFKLTGRRAARVDEAVADFYQDNGRYPDSLAELTPHYLLYLPPPVVVRQGGWCYQGGQDFYRLGYVSGHFTYFEADFYAETYAQAGELPPGSWNCDHLVAKFNTGQYTP